MLGMHYLAAAGAAFGAGVVNALAGGGTLISFPTLVALGLPAVSANVTNTVALCPGYFGGTWAQRADLEAYRKQLLPLSLAAGLGGLGGSVLLVLSSESLFRGLVPFLILFACLLLALQDWIRKRLAPKEAPAEQRPLSPLLVAVVFLAAVYGGYFGAGLGIMLLAMLGLGLGDSLTQLNAMKQALSTIINVVAALFFVFSGKVAWGVAAVMAAASLVGGNLGGRLAGRLNPKILRAVVVAFGVAVAVKFWLY
jgi:uncharacterized membrane protein YfcA